MHQGSEDRSLIQGTLSGVAREGKPHRGQYGELIPLRQRPLRQRGGGGTNPPPYLWLFVLRFPSISVISGKSSMTQLNSTLVIHSSSLPSPSTILQTFVVKVVEVGLDVVGVGIDVCQKEFGDRRLADFQLLDQPQNQSRARLVLLLKSRPPLAGAATRLSPSHFFARLLHHPANLLLAPTPGIADP